MTEPCPFCHPPPDRIIFDDDLLFGLWDGYPVSPGHALIVPKRHAETWTDLKKHEQLGIVDAITRAQGEVELQHQPDGYNIGINSGAAAGQTILHLHVHVIPRYHGDVSDPRGGVRWVVPGKADYWNDKS